MKKENTNKMHVVIMLLAALVIALSLGVYIIQMNRYIHNSTTQTIEELAAHDQVLVDDYMQSNWNSLNQMVQEMESLKPENVEQMENYLNLMTASSNFSHVFLVNKEGTIYSDKYTHYSSTPQDGSGLTDLMSYFKPGQKRVAARYDVMDPADGISKESILFGLALNDIQIAGQTFTNVIGLCDLNQVKDKMLVPSFDQKGTSQGYSAVIDGSGTFLVDVDESVYLDSHPNLYAQLEMAQKSELSPDQVKENISRKQKFSFRYLNDKGVEYIVTALPFDSQDSSWYFVTSIEYKFFEIQSRNFILMSVMVLLIILMVVGGLLLTINKTNVREHKAAVQSQSQTSFLRTMSHEIRNPLNGLIGLIHLLKQEIKEGYPKEQVEEKLEKADITATYLMKLVNNIMDFTKLQSDEVILWEQPASLSEIVDSVWDMQKDPMDQKHIQGVLSKEIIQDSIMVDELRLKQILMNLLSNACKFTDEKGQVSLRIMQKAVGDDEVQTTIVCQDTGCGMSLAFLDHIWDSFTQEQSSLQGMQGAGLGLAITKQLLDAMNATVDVSSAQGIGTNFTISFNSKAAHVGSKVLTTQQEDEDIVSKVKKILIAEDNEMNAEILTELLEDQGFETVLAVNGAQAVEAFRKSEIGEIGAILMDMTMPEMDGTQAVQIIRALNRPDAATVLILACTANIYMEDREKAIRSGMDDFIPKPVDPNELMEMLKKKRK